MNYTTLSLWQVLEEKSEITDSLAGNLFPRLEEVVDAINGTVDFTISAGTDEQLQESVRGSVEVSVDVACQRCLEPFPEKIQVAFRWVLAHSESDADRIGDDDDILIVEEEDPQGLLYHIEDEILLALPVIPMHADHEPCEGRTFLENQEVIEVEEDDKKNPFAVLANLMDK